MKMKKAMALSLTAVLAASVFTGCSTGSQGSSGNSQVSGSTTPKTSTANSSSTSTADSAPAPIRIFNRLNAEVQVDNNPILQELEKRLNIIIDYEAPPSTATPISCKSQWPPAIFRTLSTTMEDPIPTTSNG